MKNIDCQIRIRLDGQLWVEFDKHFRTQLGDRFTRRFIIRLKRPIDRQLRTPLFMQLKIYKK